jgi:hypothetical protein
MCIKTLNRNLLQLQNIIKRHIIFLHGTIDFTLKELCDEILSIKKKYYTQNINFLIISVAPPAMAGTHD